MPRTYVEGDQVRFTRRDFCLVDAEFYDGRHYESLEPRRLFPLSGLRKYITLLDEDGKEIAIVRDLDTLMPEARAILESCLDEYYFIPRITSINDVTDKHGVFKWDVVTDHGRRVFSVRNRHSDVKVLYDGRVLIRDSDDNRYEIPAGAELDARSAKLLGNEL